MNVFLFIVFSIFSLVENRTIINDSGLANPRCTHCRYSLRGLPGEGLCPECGQPYHPSKQVTTRERIALRRGALPFWLFCLVAFALLLTTRAGERLYAWSTIKSYLDDGYRLDVATNAAFKRELRNGAALGAQWFAEWWFACSPLLCVLLRGWRRYPAFILGALAILAFLLWAGGGRAP